MNRQKIAKELVKLARDLTGGAERDYLFLGRMQMDLDYALNEHQQSYGAEKHLMMLNFEDQIKEMKKLWNRVDEKPEWLTKRDIADYEKRIKKFRRSKQGASRVAAQDVNSVIADILGYLEAADKLLPGLAKARHREFYNVDNERHDAIGKFMGMLGQDVSDALDASERIQKEVRNRRPA